MIFHSPKRIRRSISQNKSELDEEIIQLYQTVIKKQQLGYTLEDLLPHNDENFKIISYIMTKIIKNDNEIFLIKLYLQNLKKFISIFKDTTTPLKDLLEKISDQIIVENICINTMVCKTGDKGDKVYLLLKGNVSVLLQKEIIVSISKIDYLCYLVKLHLYQENDLISRILMVNREKYGIDERELNMLFSMFHLYKFFIENKIKKTFTLFGYFYESNNSIKEQIRYKFDLPPEKVLHLGGMDDFMMNEIWNFYNISYDSIIENYNKTNLENYENFINNNNNENEQNNNINSKSSTTKRVSIKPKIIKGNNTKIPIKRKSLDLIIDEILSTPSLPYEVVYNIDKENYQKRFIPNKIEKSELVDFKLYEYMEITTLGEGDIFGEIALQNSSKKRTATIITTENCVFGTLTKNLYNFCLRSTQDKLRNNLIQFFLNGPIFKGVNQTIFESKYYNWFIKRKYKNKKVLFRQGEKRERIFFIIKGEVELNTKMSFPEINKLIEYNKIDSNDIQARKYCYESTDFDKYYNDEVQSFKLGCFKDNEIIGLDYFLKDGKFICDCEIYSLSCSVFELEENLYQNLLNDFQLRSNIEKLNDQKKKILCQRLIKIRDTKIENEISNIRISNRGNKIFFRENRIKKSNLLISLMKSAKVRKNIKLSKLPESEIIPFNYQSNRKSIISRNINSTKNTKKNYSTFSADRDNLKINSFSIKNNNNFLLKKNPNNSNSVLNLDEKPIYSFTNLKFFKRKNFSLSEAKNILNKKPLLSLKALRTKELILPKGNNIKVVKKRYNEKKLLNKEEEFYMTHSHVFSKILKSESIQSSKNLITNIVDVLALDNWAEKLYENPQKKKTYIPKLKIRNKSFNINI